MDGVSFERDVLVVEVYEGPRGRQGPKGPAGDAGPQGPGITVKGTWSSGTTYGPQDAVTADSSLVQGIKSLYIQKESVASSVSTTPPGQDPARWLEIGALDWDSAFGGIWEVNQIAHGFTKIGQPVAYSQTANRYVLADARFEEKLGIAVVREVVSPDRVILQSTGEVPDIDAEVIYPDGSSWVPGATYYVSVLTGRLTIMPPSDPSAYVNPIIRAADQNGTPSKRNGVALPWTPVAVTTVQRVPAGVDKFYFTLSAGQTVVTGADDLGNTLSYTPGTSTDVFVAGANLFYDDYTATDGSTVNLATSYPAGTTVEIWTAAEPNALVVDATTLKLDSIESQFDGSTTVFSLEYLGVGIDLQSTSSVQIWLDGNPQEPGLDFTIIPDPGDANLSAVEFLSAPELGTRFWGIALAPAGERLPPGGVAGDILVKDSAADGDASWSDVLFGGSF